MGTETRLNIDRLWHGEEALSSERVEVAFTLAGPSLHVTVDASFHGDPAPPAPPGRTDGLWNYEVVELFLANEAGHYLELEFGPHSHFLALQFDGIRQLVRQQPPLSYRAAIMGRRWQGWATVPLAGLPTDLTLANAFAIHGLGCERRYLAACPLPGPRPDFHQPHRFVSFTTVSADDRARPAAPGPD